MASKSYDWNVRNIAKISPKMAKKQPFFDFFRFSQKLSIRFERNFLQSFYTILWSFAGNFIKFVWLECEKQPKCTQKWPKKTAIFRLFIIAKTIHTIRLCTVILHHIYYGPLCAILSNSYDWDSSESEGKRRKPTPLPHMRLWFEKFTTFVASVCEARLRLCVQYFVVIFFL